jgi:Holliday junction resolvase
VSAARGISRERALKKILESQDWFVARAAGSLGDADLIALREGDRPRLIEVKSSSAGPFHSFGPAKREELLLAARIAGAQAWLVWWPVRRDPVWLAPEAWPKGKVA